MNKPKTAALRFEILGQYSEIIVTVRRRYKGLRIGYFQYIMAIGDNKQGLRCADMSKLLNRTWQNTLDALNRVIKAGYILKTTDKRYLLTDKGRAVYDAVCAAFEPSLERIIKLLTAEYIKRAQGE